MHADDDWLRCTESMESADTPHESRDQRDLQNVPTQFVISEDAYTDMIETRLEEARLNMIRNRKPFRYGEPSPITCSKKRRLDDEDGEAEGSYLCRAAQLAHAPLAPAPAHDGAP